MTQIIEEIPRLKNHDVFLVSSKYSLGSSLHNIWIRNCFQCTQSVAKACLWRHQSALLSNRCVHSQLGGRALAVTAESNGAGDRLSKRGFLALVLWVLKGRNGCRVIIRIETGHSNLVSCFGPRMRALARYFTSAFASVKYLSQRPHPRAKTWHKIWMTGLNPTSISRSSCCQW